VWAFSVFGSLNWGFYMPENTAEVKATVGKGGFGLSLDWWAVLLAFLLAALVKLGVLQHVWW